MGACVCIPSDQDRKNDLAGFVQRSKANWALLTPTVAELLDPSTVPSFKFVTLGGESINGATLRKWLQVCRVGINYGSAEVDVTHARDVQNDSDVSNVGQRLPSCTAFIVDPDNPAIILPVGAMGELVISGPTMAREYLNAPEKTAQVFMKPPENWYTQGVIPKENPPWMSRIYLMGDLFRQKCDGSLEFVSRKDFQVKVNGKPRTAHSFPS
jgi:non-ribosomal peptide synthetase component F